MGASGWTPPHKRKSITNKTASTHRLIGFKIKMQTHSMLSHSLSTHTSIIPPALIHQTNVAHIFTIRISSLFQGGSSLFLLFVSHITSHEEIFLVLFRRFSSMCVLFFFFVFSVARHFFFSISMYAREINCYSSQLCKAMTMLAHRHTLAHTHWDINVTHT